MTRPAAPPPPDLSERSVTFRTAAAFWEEWWRNWYLYGTVYAINNPEPRIVPAETLTVHEGPCPAVPTVQQLARAIADQEPHTCSDDFRTCAESILAALLSDTEASRP